MNTVYYYEDFAIGQRFCSGPCRMHKERMMAFAAEFDPQPQHISERDARSSQFGALVASGWHTAAVSMRLFIAEALPPIAGGGQGLGIEALSWPHPVRPGDELRVVTEVTATRPSRSRPDNDDGFWPKSEDIGMFEPPFCCAQNHAEPGAKHTRSRFPQPKRHEGSFVPRGRSLRSNRVGP
jgi:acyl dehydratase